jgi:hypothetical protein
VYFDYRFQVDAASAIDGFSVELLDARGATALSAEAPVSATANVRQRAVFDGGSAETDGIQLLITSTDTYDAGHPDDLVVEVQDTYLEFDPAQPRLSY